VSERAVQTAPKGVPPRSPPARTADASPLRLALVGLALITILGALATDALPSPAASAPALAALPWDAHATIHHLRTLRDPNRVLIFENAATPDGRDLVLGIQPRAFPETDQPSEIALYDIATAAITPVAALQSPASQIIAAAADAHWIAWSEAADPNDYAWTLFAFNRQTQRITRIAQAATDATGQPIPGPAPMPCFAAGRLIWGQVIGPLNPPDLHNAIIRAADPATGASTTLATSAGSPACGAPWVAWDQGTAAIVAHNLLTGATRTIPGGASSLALSSASLAYITGDLHAICLIPDLAASTSPTTIVTGTNLQFVALSPRYVAWDAMSAAVAWDRVTNQSRALPQLPGTTTSAAIWFDADPADSRGSIINIAANL
jgi:hypothetical protein